jgi:endogenous inhibitor of DNA gyrase (YacG/DUF329 family)
MDEIELRGETAECPICGASFYISAQEAAWFNRKNLHLPRKCPLCRKQSRRRTGTMDKTQFNDEEFRAAMSRARGEIAKWER